MSEIEWFASPNDLARAMLWMHHAMTRSGLEPLKKVLSINPGLPFDRATWTYVGFKGGGEPGVLNFTWLLKRFDDRWFVVSCGLNDDEKSPDILTASGLMIAAGPLLAQQRKKPKRRRSGVSARGEGAFLRGLGSVWTLSPPALNISRCP